MEHNVTTVNKVVPYWSECRQNFPTEVWPVIQALWNKCH